MRFSRVPMLPAVLAPVLLVLSALVSPVLAQPVPGPSNTLNTFTQAPLPCAQDVECAQATAGTICVAGTCVPQCVDSDAGVSIKPLLSDNPQLIVPGQVTHYEKIGPPLKGVWTLKKAKDACKGVLKDPATNQSKWMLLEQVCRTSGAGSALLIHDIAATFCAAGTVCQYGTDPATGISAVFCGCESAKDPCCIKGQKTATDVCPDLKGCQTDASACPPDPCQGVTIDDNNVCTNDSCDSVTGAIAHLPIAVDDNNACTTDTCDPVKGLLHTPVKVNDNNACTTDSCDPAIGVQHVPLGFTDHNACTTDSCNPQVGPVYTPIPLDDGNLCTKDTCNPFTGPLHTPIAVDDGNLCTKDTCDPKKGALHTPVNVDDGNLCTKDVCDPKKGVVHTPVSIDDGNLCTKDTCNPTTGPLHTPVKIDDNNACTTDSCDPTTGVKHVLVPLSDHNACTSDSCNPIKGLIHTPVNVDDGNGCTVDTCDPALGPQHVQVSVDDKNKCTIDTCDPKVGPLHTPIPLDDGNFCTLDKCYSAWGIFHLPITVDDDNWCTTDSCDPQSGAVHTPVNPDDGNPCTEDTCLATFGVINKPISTSDGNKCTVDACDTATGAVTHTPISVDDNNPCTFDVCNPLTGKGIHTAVSTDDGNLCTVDTCDPATGQILHDPQDAACGDGDACNGEETCDMTKGCQAGTALNVDDCNACTTDACDPATGQAFHTPLTCPATQQCNVKTGQCEGQSDQGRLATGQYHTCHIKKGEQTVACWGQNNFGQLGNLTWQASWEHTLVLVEDPTGGIPLQGAIAIAAGLYHSCALFPDGSARCWGNNAYGQGGDGTTQNHNSATLVAALANGSEIAAGGYHTCTLQLIPACQSQTDVSCWGEGGSGELGNGTYQDQTTPMPIAMPAGVTMSTVGAGTFHTCAITDDDALYCWGENIQGQIGPFPVLSVLEPMLITIAPVTQAVGGLTHTCALLQEGGEVQCWGTNTFGQLGSGQVGSGIKQSAPQTVLKMNGEPLSGIALLTAGYQHTCAAEANGPVWCWGVNKYGQLGDGTTKHSGWPVQVVVPGITSVVALAAGANHTCALLKDDTVTCWGGNTYGQLGVPPGTGIPLCDPYGNPKCSDIAGTPMCDSNGSPTCVDSQAVCDPYGTLTCGPDLCNDKVIPDDDACTTDSCDPATGTVFHTPIACPGGQACNTQTGQCESTLTCPVANILKPSEITAEDKNNNGISDSCEFPQIVVSDPYGTPSLSADGRFVASKSGATDLIAGDTNGYEDLFVHDRQTGETTRVNVSTTGLQANEASYSPVLSADGQFVAFESSATNLVPGDTNGKPDIFIHARQTGITTRVSVDSDGGQANGSSFSPALSANGQIVAFLSVANLVTGDTNGKFDIFVHDRQTGETTRVNVSTTGLQANEASYSPVLSADGQFVAFESSATNLVPGDTNGKPDIFVRARQTGITTRVSVNSGGGQANGLSLSPVLSADGFFVAFRSGATNLVANDANGPSWYDIFVHDRLTGETSQVSVNTAGLQADKGATGPALSAEGRFVAFESSATNLVPDDTNGKSDIFVHDRQTGETIRVNVSTTGLQANLDNYWSNALTLSADGRFVAFASSATNLVPEDTNNSPDLFITINPLWTPPPGP